jgi:KipI family sensor histidine kinase inhibitor
MQYRLLPCGDAALCVEFGERIDPMLAAQVACLYETLNFLREGSGIVEMVPTFRSLTILFDPLLTDGKKVGNLVAKALAKPKKKSAKSERRWNLPALYGGEYGADLEFCAKTKGISVARLVELHSQSDLQVYMLGFLPGFAFLGDLPEEIAMPRRAEPRLRVLSGTLAMTGRLTAIYPWESPGGWNLLGACPVPLFNPAWSEPALLRPGDHLRFTPISEDEYADLCRTEIDPGRFLA